MLGDISIKDFWELFPEPPHWQMKRVTVRVSEDQFNNAKAMATINKNLLGRLGCEGCQSGFVFDYLIERDFRVNPQLGIDATNIGLRG